MKEQNSPSLLCFEAAHPQEREGSCLPRFEAHIQMLSLALLAGPDFLLSGLSTKNPDLFPESIKVP